MKVASGCTVEFQYELFDKDGRRVDSSDEENVRYQHGTGEILPALEAALEGSEAGAALKLDLEPDDAFGPHDPEGLISLPKGFFEGQVEIKPDDWVTVHAEAEDSPASGSEEDEGVEMRVVEIGEEEVILDANHPLAGQKVTFEVKVLSVS